VTMTSTFDVLFADTFPYRHGQLRIKGSTSEKMVCQKHCHTADELLQALPEKLWDVVFVPGYFTKHHEMADVIKALCTIPIRPRLVIFHGTDDTFGFCRQLRNVGYLVTHIPWDFAAPSSHIRKDPKQAQLLLPEKN